MLLVATNLLLTINNTGDRVSQSYCNDQSLYVARLIEGYLRSHPEAMDSFDGISKWWITRQKLYESADAVNCALSILVDKGVIEKVDNECYRYANTNL